MIAVALAIGALLAGGAFAWRLARGPSVHDRALGLVGLVAALAIAAAAGAAFLNDAALADLALMLLAIGFLMAAALLKAVRGAPFQMPLAREAPVSGPAGERRG